MNPDTRMQRQEAADLLTWAERVIQQTHYETLESLVPVPLEQSISEIRSGDVVCLYQVTELVFRKAEGTFARLTTVLNSLHICGASCLMLLQCQEGRCELYLGAVNKQKYDNPLYLNMIRELLRSGLEGNLPGTELKELVSRQAIESKLRQCLDNGFDSQCITSVSCVAGEQERDQGMGIESLVEAIGPKNFALLVLADPVEHEQMQLVRQGYEDLSTQLSVLEAVSLTEQSSISDSTSSNYMTTLSVNMAASVAKTQSHTISSSWSKGGGRSVPEQNGKEKLVKAASVAAGLGAMALSKDVDGGMSPYFAMNAVNSLFGGQSAQTSENNSEGGGESVLNGTQETVNKGVTKGEQAGSGKSHSETRGLNLQATMKNRHIAELLSRVEGYLQWLNRCENYGMFNCCAYVISASADVNLSVASQYQALMQGNGEINQPIAINTWTRENGIEHVRQSLLHLIHPAIYCPDLEEPFTPAMLLSSRELSRQMALPQKSVVGVSVMEYASFGREVVRKTPLRSGRTAKVGVISHMGKAVTQQPVLLDLQSMAAHTFVAGTNGSGKSNTIFCLLEELLEANIPFMVVEPAKGEYKNVFRGEDGVKVYGTNRTKTPLLRLNPFWFNEDVNVKEHIAKLMDVFNASWPMYAAMPAVLNGAIENAYRACGWNLSTSRCSGMRVFPTVRDVLEAVTQKMKSSAFSEEVQGNYVGALATRLESLCDGIFTDIFSGADLGDQALFEHNVIIDVSRAGSPETSAMIMGILLIRLREYRMSEGAMNHPLRHVTVLEEAHHLLRRTSTAQSSEGSNMMGKAVEMISNAIAEMRSYGDGFIIADQSPGLLDESVLRNTNTKIILRLPDGRDREVVSATMGLNQEQCYELSRLKTGICAIYQKDWLEAVLCQVNQAAHQETLYQMPDVLDEDDRNRRELVSQLLACFVYEEPNVFDMRQLAMVVGMSGTLRRNLLRYLGTISPDGNRVGNVPEWNSCARLVAELFPLTMELPSQISDSAAKQWLEETVEVNELQEWPKDKTLLNGLIAANLIHAAEEEPRWRELLRYFPVKRSEANLSGIRGNVLKAVCLGKGVDEQQPSDQDLQTWYNDLSVSAREDDQVLSGLLKRYQSDKLSRKKGELAPYARLAWNYAGGDESWDRNYPLIQEGDTVGWDASLRKAFSQRVLCGRELCTELMSLLLQHKGKDPTVQKFYYKWFAQTKKGNLTAKCEADR